MAKARATARVVGTKPAGLKSSVVKTAGGKTNGRKPKVALVEAPTAAQGRQAQKSEATRIQVVDAAIRCLVKYGYAQTTTLQIAAEAGISRGAITHHFAHRLAVVQAAIEHLHGKRLRAFRRAVSAIPQESDQAHDALIAYWNHATHPLFTAFHELAVAARTDPDLAAIMSTVTKEFHAEWLATASAMFPDWQAVPNNFLLALALTRNLLEGMAINRLTGELDTKTEKALLGFLEEQIHQLAPPRRKTK